MKLTNSARMLFFTIAFLWTIWVTDTSMQVEAQTNNQFCHDGASPSEIDVWNTLLAKYGQSTALLDWHRTAYQAMQAYWTGWGYEDPFNINRPYAKFLNAAYLLKEGLSDNVQNQWHGSIDYQDVGQALSVHSHYNIIYLPSVRRDWLAYAKTSYIDRETLLGCLLFDQNEPTNNPAMRASDFIHEGWHHWQQANNKYVGHIQGQAPCCQMSGANCDQYYWHRIGDYQFGYMWMEGWSSDGQRRLSHSPNQAQV